MDIFDSDGRRAMLRSIGRAWNACLASFYVFGLQFITNFTICDFRLEDGYVILYYTCRQLVEVLLEIGPIFVEVFFFILLYQLQERVHSLVSQIESMRSYERQETLNLPSVEETIKLWSVRPRGLIGDLKKLRKIHEQVIAFSEDIMSRFQIDLLCSLAALFYSCVLFTYGVVFNLPNILKSDRISLYIFMNFNEALYNILRVWFICYGPTLFNGQV